MKKHYVTFEQAKALFEKGFKEKTFAFYEKNNTNIHVSSISYWSEFNAYAAPENHEVVEWLRVNHNIWIAVLPSYVYDGKWYYHRFHLLDPTKDSEPELVDKFNSPQEAYSAAFDYILNNNLI